MPRYYFDSRDGDTFIQDDIGLELPSIEEARDQAALCLAVEIKGELAQQRTTAASLVQELAAARGENEQLKAHSDGERTQQHGNVPSLTHELAASRLEIARLKDEAGAAAVPWGTLPNRFRFVEVSA